MIPNYTQLISNVLGQRPQVDEERARDELDQCSRRLGAFIPKPLQDFYCAVAQTAFAVSFNRFLPSSDWSLEGPGIMFMEENQGVCYWAVESPKPDESAPWRVFQGVLLENGELEWHPEPTPLAEFLKLVLLWQAVSGGSPRCAFAELAADPRPAIDAFIPLAVADDSLSTYVLGGLVVCVARGEDSFNLYCGAPTDTQLRSFAGRLELEWDWSSEMEK